METNSMKRHMGLRAANTLTNTVIHVLLVVISVIVLAAEALIIIPDKLPWNRRKGDQNGQSRRYHL